MIINCKYKFYLIISGYDTTVEINSVGKPAYLQLKILCLYIFLKKSYRTK